MLEFYVTKLDKDHTILQLIDWYLGFVLNIMSLLQKIKS